MYLPGVTRRQAMVEGVTTFGGLDRSMTAGDGWFQRDLNLSSDQYPALTVRAARGVYAKPSGMGEVSGGVVIEDKLCAVDGDSVWIGDEKVSLGLSEGKKLLLPFSYYLLIWPDRKYVNVLDVADRGDMRDSQYLFGADGVQVQVVDDTGHGVRFCQVDAPDDTAGVRAGDLWLCQRHEEGLLTVEPRLYRAVETEENGLAVIVWQEVEAYLYFSRLMNNQFYDLYDCLTEGETVILGGFKASNAMIGRPEKADIDTLNGTHIVTNVTLYDSPTVYTVGFTVRGIINESSFQFGVSDGMVTVERAVPVFDCAVVCDGRVYGAYRGVSHVSGEDVNEIYISAADDFKRYYRVEDTTADPLIMSVTEPGQFRGAALVGGVVTFFKDSKILTVGGSTPSSFYLNTYDGRGPSAGCEGSLCVLGGYVYYLSGGDVMAYYGGTVTRVSDKLGPLDGVRQAVAGGHGYKYYLATRMAVGSANTQEMFVLDTRRGLWHTEKAPAGGVVCFADCRSGLYMIDGRGRILTVGDHEIMGGKVSGEERYIQWYCESGMIGLETPQKKYISKVEVRILLEAGATAALSVEYDSTGEWRQIWRAEAGATRTVMSRTVPHRCDHLRLRLEGRGRATLLGIFRTVETEGSR